MVAASAGTSVVEELAVADGSGSGGSTGSCRTLVLECTEDQTPNASFRFE
jgi:hypothetical protein